MGAFDLNHTIVKKLRLLGSTASAETDTGFDLPSDAVIRNAFLYVQTAEASETVDVGILSTATTGDADGILDGVSMATAGWVFPTATHSATGKKWDSTTWGAYMRHFVAGTNSTIPGVFAMKPSGYQVTSAHGKSVSYTGSSTSSTWVADLYLVFDHFPAMAE